MVEQGNKTKSDMAIPEVQETSSQKLINSLALEAGLDAGVSGINEIGALVSALMNKRELTGERCAEYARVSPSFVSRLRYNGSLPRTRQRRELGDDRYRRLAQALGINEKNFVNLIILLQTNPNDDIAIPALDTEDRCLAYCRVNILKCLGWHDDNVNETFAAEMKVEKLLKNFLSAYNAVLKNEAWNSESSESMDLASIPEVVRYFRISCMSMLGNFGDASADIAFVKEVTIEGLLSKLFNRVRSLPDSHT